MTTFFDYFLRFTDEQEAHTILEQAGFEVVHEIEDEVIRASSETATVYHVGIISEGGEWDEDGTVITEPTVIEGWHVNIRLREDMTEEQAALFVGKIENPETPKVIFG